jgi:outer membrane protein OmpA-like peptidoglycan-associated protein
MRTDYSEVYRYCSTGFCVSAGRGQQMSLIRRAASSLGLFGCAVLVAACSHATQAGPNAAATTPPPVAPPSPSKPSVGQEVAAVADNKVRVLFGEGSATLTPEANKQLDLAARLFRDANPVLMFSTGHTDKTGDEYANLLLSARRAEAVKRALVARGIPADRLLVQALGESELADSDTPTAPENRSVTITWRLL